MSNQTPDAMREIVLASSSPRRRMLLESAGLHIAVHAADIDETPQLGEHPRGLVLRLAREKAAKVHALVGDAPTIIAADTTVVLDDEALNKPADDDEARRMLTRLSGRPHEVLTGFCVRRKDSMIVDVVQTIVTFRALRSADIDAYLAKGEHNDKAGSYGIQAGGGALVDTITGSFTNIVGLPMREVLEALSRVDGSGA